MKFQLLSKNFSRLLAIRGYRYYIYKSNVKLYFYGVNFDKEPPQCSGRTGSEASGEVETYLVLCRDAAGCIGRDISLSAGLECT